MGCKAAWLLSVLVLTSAALSEERAAAHFVKAGQANCTVLEFPCGVVLIDCGVDSHHTDAVTTYLDKLFERRPDLNRTIEAIFITHPHIDHTSSLRPVIERFNVRRLVDSGQIEGMGGRAQRWVRQEVAEERLDLVLREVADEEIASLATITGLADAEIDPLRCDRCDPEIRILSAARYVDPGWAPGAFENANNHSLVIRIDYGSASLLFTGDLEEHAAETLVARYRGTRMHDVDVYKVGHHGSHNGTTDHLLQVMTPHIAVISMGRWDYGRRAGGQATPFTTFAYGHPRTTILEMLEERIRGYRSQPVKVMAGLGSRRFQEYTVRRRIYATGWDGTIQLAFSADRDYRTMTRN
jgi:competence protein ComEC